MMDFVNGKDDVPYMKWTIKHVWNHQPGLKPQEKHQVWTMSTRFEPWPQLGRKKTPETSWGLTKDWPKWIYNIYKQYNNQTVIHDSTLEYPWDPLNMAKELVVYLQSPPNDSCFKSVSCTLRDGFRDSNEFCLGSGDLDVSGDSLRTSRSQSSRTSICWID